MEMGASDDNPRDRRSPWPRAGASAAVFRNDRVLLVERAKGALAGQWSLPGGHIEAGETAAAAAIREVLEEAGVSARTVGLAGVHDVILRGEDGMLSAHYLLAVYAADWLAGEPVAASDSRSARFVPLADLGRLRLTPGAAELIARAHAILREGPDPGRGASQDA
jgi:ADP-ribose pyrophosphatase YjhB (NUDIX family)